MKHIIKKNEKLYITLVYILHVLHVTLVYILHLY